MNRSMTAAACAAAGVLIAFPAAAACSLKTQPIPITMTGAVPGSNNGIPTANVKVNGKPGHFMVDSSAAVNQISTKFASSQKLASTKAGNTEIFTSPKFEIAGAGLDNAQFMGSSRLPDVDGVLGQTVLGLMDVEYDLAGGKVVLAKADGCETSNMAYWAKDGDLYWEMPLVAASNGAPLTETEITVNGVKLRALFGTASSYTVITKAAAEKAGVKTTDAGVTPIKGAEGRWLGNFTVNVGGEELKNAPLEISASTDTYYDVLIGADYFLTHHLYVANSQKKIYATRSGFPGAPVFQAHQAVSKGMDTSPASRGRLGL
jgi:predicted aspartyl protease